MDALLEENIPQPRGRRTSTSRVSSTTIAYSEEGAIERAEEGDFVDGDGDDDDEESDNEEEDNEEEEEEE